MFTRPWTAFLNTSSVRFDVEEMTLTLNAQSSALGSGVSLRESLLVVYLRFSALMTGRSNESRWPVLLTKTSPVARRARLDGVVRSGEEELCIDQLEKHV